MRSEISKELFFQQQIVDYRARAGAGAAILTSWSRAKQKLIRAVDPHSLFADPDPALKTCGVI